jgi:hypothetical protein
MFIQHEKTGLLWRVTLAISAGIILGGSAASVENRVCAKSEAPSASCLTEIPRVRVAHGMVGGMFASAGAMLMIEGWERFRNAGD